MVSKTRKIILKRRKLVSVLKPKIHRKDTDWLGRKKETAPDWLGRKSKKKPDWLGRK